MKISLKSLQSSVRAVFLSSFKPFYKTASHKECVKIFRFMWAVTSLRDTQDLRLSTCLAIDLINGNVDPSKIWYILTHLEDDLKKYEAESVGVYFYNACKHIEDNDISINVTSYSDISSSKLPVLSNFTYARVIPLASYIKRELINHPEFAYETDRKFNDRLGLGSVGKPDPTAFKRAIEGFDWTVYFLNTDEAIPFRGYNDHPDPVYIRTGRRFSWLVRSEELTDENNKVTDADSIADRLGLLISNDPTAPTTYQIYISLNMPGPQPVKNVGYQPAAIHGGWRSPNLFISSDSSDGWGRSFAVNNSQSVEERILLEFNAAEENSIPIKGNVIGILQRARDPEDLTVYNMNEVLIEAIHRLQNILGKDE